MMLSTSVPTGSDEAVMKNLLSALLLSAAVVSSVRASAQAPGGTGPGDEAAAPGAQSVPASTTLRVRGTIDKYDASTRILSLATSNGTVQFAVASTARIREGWHKIDALELKRLAGYQAAIGYLDSGGTKTVESVHVFGKNERTK
jgi:hypothetical protein